MSIQRQCHCGCKATVRGHIGDILVGNYSFTEDDFAAGRQAVIDSIYSTESDQSGERGEDLAITREDVEEYVQWIEDSIAPDVRPAPAHTYTLEREQGDVTLWRREPTGWSEVQTGTAHGWQPCCPACSADVENRDDVRAWEPVDGTRCYLCGENGEATIYRVKGLAARATNWRNARRSFARLIEEQSSWMIATYGPDDHSAIVCPACVDKCSPHGRVPVSDLDEFDRPNRGTVCELCKVAKFTK